MLEGVEQCAGTDGAGYAATPGVSTFTGTAACSVALESGKAYDVVLVSSDGVFSSTQISR